MNKLLTLLNNGFASMPVHLEHCIKNVTERQNTGINNECEKNTCHRMYATLPEAERKGTPLCMLNLKKTHDMDLAVGESMTHH